MSSEPAGRPRRVTTVSAPAHPARAAASTARGVSWRFVAALAAMLLIAVVVRTQLVDIVRVSSDSMAPTVCTGGTVVVSRLRAGTPVHVDDIVTFSSPTDGAETIKRVVAVEGQSVAIEDAQLVVDGQVVNEPYVDHATIDGVYFGPVRVPAGSVFLLGDHREVSIDSRAFGAVPVTSLDGRMLTTVLTSCSS